MHHAFPEHLQRFLEPARVLDHGHVQLVDVYGDDARVECAARLSYEGKRKISDTRNLLRYLLRNAHTSPFEQCCLTLDIRMPIFVARQLVRHRTAKLNEVSGRYSELPADFYIPRAEDICYQATDNKQGRSGPLPVEEAEAWLLAHAKDAWPAYWMEVEGKDYDVTDLYCAEHIDEAIAATPGGELGGECWSGDDHFVFCKTCERLLDSGGLTDYGVQDALIGIRDEGFSPGADETRQLWFAMDTRNGCTGKGLVTDEDWSTIIRHVEALAEEAATPPTTVQNVTAPPEAP